VPDFSPEASVPIEDSSNGKTSQAPVSQLIDNLIQAEKELLTLIQQLKVCLTTACLKEIWSDFI
jgi:PmbA protein